MIWLSGIVVPQESTGHSNLGCGSIITSSTIAGILEIFGRGTFFTSGTII